jgi:hypothetical protein
VLWEATGRRLPGDSWDTPMSYNSFTEGIADATPRERGASAAIAFESQDYELRSAGPDGRVGTEDDIVMRNGVFCTSLDVLTNPIPIQKNVLGR